jgi:hypothetical protein
MQHAENQKTAKDMARDVLKEVIQEVDFKTSKLEMPTAVTALRRMKAEEKRKMFYETEEDWVAMVKAEWIAEIRGDNKANKEAKELTEAGEVEKAKEVKRLRLAAKVESKRVVEEQEERDGAKRTLEAGAPEQLDDEAIAAAEKAKADALGLGSISPEIMAAMAAQREAAAAAKEAADKVKEAAKNGVCAQCMTNAASQKCSRCLEVGYCGRECQVAHWKAHKKACKESCEKKAAANAAA